MLDGSVPVPLARVPKSALIIVYDPSPSGSLDINPEIVYHKSVVASYTSVLGFDTKDPVTIGDTRFGHDTFGGARLSVVAEIGRDFFISDTSVFSLISSAIVTT